MERLGLTDRETTLQIMENPYLQFFLGYSGYVDQEPFHHSLMTHFRARLGADILIEVNDWIAKEGLKAEQEETSKSKEEATKDKDDDDPDSSQLTMEVGAALTVPKAAKLPAQKVRKPMKPLKVLPPKSSENGTNRGMLMLDAKVCAS